MKKSNIILVALLVGLYITPAIVWGICRIRSTGDYYTEFGTNIQTVKIENLDLKKEDVLIKAGSASKIQVNVFNIKQGDDNSYLFYQGTKKYLPEANVEDQILFVGKAANAPSGEKLKLHIQINDISEITLNGEIIWRR
jgi:hypothetical protein